MSRSGRWRRNGGGFDASGGLDAGTAADGSAPWPASDAGVLSTTEFRIAVGGCSATGRPTAVRWALLALMWGTRRKL